MRARVEGMEVAGLGCGSIEPDGQFVSKMLELGKEELLLVNKSIVGKRLHRRDEAPGNFFVVTRCKPKDGVVIMRDHVTHVDLEVNEEELNDWTESPSPEVVGLFDSFQQKRIHEGVWEAFADEALISITNRNIDVLASLESVDFHPGTNEVVRDLVHPSLFPLLIPRGSLDTSKRNFWGRRYEDSRFQWLPAELTVDAAGKATFMSPINNLDESNYHEVRKSLEDVFSALLPGFEKVSCYYRMCVHCNLSLSRVF